MQCNIDSRGRHVRRAWGVVLLLAAIAVGVLVAWPGGAWWAWAVVGALAMFGLLGLYEAKKGWCVVRAMGFKTPV